MADLPPAGDLSINPELVTEILVRFIRNEITRTGFRRAVFGLSGGYGMELSSYHLNTFVRVNNLFDRDYVGSVIVNDGNGRFFEPGPGTNWLAGFSVTFK